jgi:hypothetical protein
VPWSSASFRAATALERYTLAQSSVLRVWVEVACGAVWLEVAGAIPSLVATGLGVVAVVPFAGRSDRELELDSLLIVDSATIQTTAIRASSRAHSTTAAPCWVWRRVIVELRIAMDLLSLKVQVRLNYGQCCLVVNFKGVV